MPQQPGLPGRAAQQEVEVWQQQEPEHLSAGPSWERQQALPRQARQAERRQWPVLLQPEAQPAAWPRPDLPGASLQSPGPGAAALPREVPGEAAEQSCAAQAWRPLREALEVAEALEALEQQPVLQRWLRALELVAAQVCWRPAPPAPCVPEWLSAHLPAWRHATSQS